jgi:hypothetical protein
MFRDLSMKFSINKRKGKDGYLYYLRLKAENYFDFIDSVEQFVKQFKCFEHKVNVSRVSKKIVKIYSNDEKKRAIKMMQEGQDLDKVANKIGCHPVTVKRWLK